MTTRGCHRKSGPARRREPIQASVMLGNDMAMNRITAQSSPRVRSTYWLAAIGLLLVSWNAHAVNCNVTVTPLDFGVYDPGAAAPLDVTGSLDVRCNGNAGSFILTLSQGTGGSFFPRQLTSGTSIMQYNLYIDAARALVWGDGIGGTDVNSGSKPSAGPPVTFSFPIYGRIFPFQSVASGLYTDSLLVTAVF